MRQQLSILYQGALLETAQGCFADCQWVAALDTCRRLLMIEPWQERAVLVGMRAALSLGDVCQPKVEMSPDCQSRNVPFWVFGGCRSRLRCGYVGGAIPVHISTASGLG